MKSGIVGHLGGIIIKKKLEWGLQYLILGAAKNKKVPGPKSAPKVIELDWQVFRYRTNLLH